MDAPTAGRSATGGGGKPRGGRQLGLRSKSKPVDATPSIPRPLALSATAASTGALRHLQQTSRPRNLRKAQSNNRPTAENNEWKIYSLVVAVHFLHFICKHGG